MPKGKPLANMMEHEVVEVLYTCIKHANIEFDQVAKELGLKDATTAKNRLSRVMKAQEKGVNGATAINSQFKVTKPAKITAKSGTKRGRKGKEGTDRADRGGAADDDGDGQMELKTEEDAEIKDEAAKSA